MVSTATVITLLVALACVSCDNLPGFTLETTNGESILSTEGGKLKAFGGKLYYLAGVQLCQGVPGAVNLYDKTMKIWDPATEKWSNGSAYSGTAFAYFGAAVHTASGTIWYYGGVNLNCALTSISVAPATFRVYNIASDSWSTVTPSNTGPGKIIGEGLEAVGDKLILAGGISGAFVGKNFIYSYDINTNTWTLLKANNPATGFHPMFNFPFTYIPYFFETSGDNIIYGFNGDLAPTDTSNTPLTALWQFNLTDNQFTLLSANATPDSTQISYGTYEHILMRFGGDDPTAPRCSNAYGSADNAESDMYVFDLRNPVNGVFRQVNYDSSTMHAVKGSAFTTVGRILNNLSGHAFVNCSSDGATDGVIVNYTDLNTFPLNRLLVSSTRNKLFDFTKSHTAPKHFIDALATISSWCDDPVDC